MPSCRGSGSAEFDLLCAVARPKPDLELAADILQRGVNWSDLLQLAASHAVRPHLIQALRDLAWDRVPSAAKTALEAFQRLHLMRVLFLTDELCRIAGAFSSNGLPFATFKGIALATAHHGNVSLREFNDIDLIVMKSRLGEAERILRSLGYRAAVDDGAFRSSFFAYQRQYAFIRTGPEVNIDLHWAFTASRLPFPLDPGEIWTDLRRVSIGGLAVPTLSGANLALLLAGHGTKERWKRLGWVCDFATCIERDSHLDWSTIFLRAQRRGCGNAVLFGCAIAEDLLGVPVPKALSALAERSDHVRALVESTSRRMREDFPDMPMGRYFPDLDLCDAWSRKAGFILGMTFTRTCGDYYAMPLPSRLWRLYHLTRPLRLAARTLSLTRRRVKIPTA